METYITLTIFTGLISWCIKVTTSDDLYNDLYNKKMKFQDLDYDEIDRLLAKELLHFSKFHYFIPGTNIVVALLYRFSYVLKKEDILKELIAKELITIENQPDTSPSDKHVDRILAIKEEQNQLLKMKEDLKDQQEKSLKLHQ